MYVTKNPKSKAEIKRRLAAGEVLHAYPPGLGEIPKGGGDVPIEGPHYPKPHRWYGIATVDGTGRILKVR